MSEYLELIFRGNGILFGDETPEIKRKKTIDTKKEIRIAKNIRKTSVLQRSSNRIKNIVKEALA